MKSQVNLLSALISDEMKSFGYSPRRDIATLESRFRHEGISFMSMALPRLNDLLLRGLKDGRLPTFVGWASQGSVPLFLSKLWLRVFDSNGVLLRDPCPAAVRSIRQITCFNKKFKVNCSDDRIAAEIGRFISLEKDYPIFDSQRLAELPRILRICFSQSIAKIHRDYFTSVRWLEPKHGPGAVAERLDPVQKWDFNTISARALDTFGHSTFFPLWEDVEPIVSTIPARLIAVPKDANKPRLICAEPSYNQFVQQGMQSVLKAEFSRRKLICDYTDQGRNQHLSRVGSIDGSLTTVDLSEASDRVGWGLVKFAFSFDQMFLRLLRDSRSEFVDTGSSILCQKKFAPMGSAMTFPIQCMIFTGLVILAACEYSSNYSSKFIRGLVQSETDYTVYGDDIIIPTHLYPLLSDLLTKAGLKINQNKTYDTGLFRESCGADWFMGVNVTPVYLRLPLDGQKGTDAILSLMSTRNQLFLAGNKESVEVLDQYLESLDRRIKYSAIPADFPLDQGRFVDGPPHKWCKDTQRPLYRGFCTVYRYDEPSGRASSLLSHYLQKISGGSGIGTSDGIGRPKASKQLLRWIG